MNAIYFSDWKHDLKRVYAPSVSERLARAFDLPPDFYGSDDLGRVDFSNVRYIFTTWGMPALGEAQIRTFFPNLECVFFAAGSVRYFAESFIKRGIKLFSAWHVNALPVAEYAVAQIVLANKGFYALTKLAKRDYAAALIERNRFVGNYDACVGILGDGAVGGEVIRRLVKDYKLNVYVYSITMRESEAKEKGVHLASLPEIFEKCDVISNHLADNAQTKKMINAALLQKMKPYSTLINTGRGAQIDEDALVAALERDRTITAVLDVTSPEPPVAGSKLYALPNVILTPHIAGSNGNEVRRMAEYIATAAEHYLKGEPTECEVTPQMLEHMA